MNLMRRNESEISRYLIPDVMELLHITYKGIVFKPGYNTRVPVASILNSCATEVCLGNSTPCKRPPGPAIL